MTTTPAIPRPRTPSEARHDSPPRAASVLAVTARPGQESADLGGLLFAFRRSGASLSLLCLTRGEAAGQNSGSALLEAVRPWETQLAASILGIRRIEVANYRDGQLHEYPTAELAEQIDRSIREHSADMLLVVAPEVGDRADTAVALAAQAAAAARPACPPSRRPGGGPAAPGRLTWAPTRKPRAPSRSPPPPPTPVSPRRCRR